MKRLVGLTFLNFLESATTKTSAPFFMTKAEISASITSALVKPESGENPSAPVNALVKTA